MELWTQRSKLHMVISNQQATTFALCPRLLVFVYDMAKQRYINTRFWEDSFIFGLESDEKLLFLYLLTNSLTTICGIYEMPLPHISFETKIEPARVAKILEKFKKDKKAYYIDGWIVICNFIKH